MRSITVVCVLVVVMVALFVDGSRAHEPADQTGQDPAVSLEAAPALPGRASRQRRFVCDTLPSALQSAACTASCLAQGKKGGSCQNGTCVCRDSSD